MGEIRQVQQCSVGLPLNAPWSRGRCADMRDQQFKLVRIWMMVIISYGRGVFRAGSKGAKWCESFSLAWCVVGMKSANGLVEAVEVAG